MIMVKGEKENVGQGICSTWKMLDEVNVGRVDGLKRRMLKSSDFSLLQLLGKWTKS